MDISSLLSNAYLKSFVGGIFSYLGVLYFFLEKLENKLKLKKEDHDKKLRKKFTGSVATIEVIIDMFDSLRNNRHDFNKVKNILDLVHYSGAFYLIGCLLGFMLQLLGMREDLSVAIIALALTYFFISLIYLIIWNRKN